MRKISKLATATVALAAAVTGCQQQGKAPAESASASVLDVRPAPKSAPTYALSPQFVTPPDEPRPDVVTGPVKTVTPGYSAAQPAQPKPAKPGKAAPQQANSYKVKKGDTLYRIAKTEYGDGKKWTLIASANPGISPQTLKTGQTLVIP